MLRKITCPVCHTQSMLDDGIRIQYCQCCGNMLTIHNANLDKGKNKGRNTFLAVCAILFLAFVGVVSSGDSDSDKNNTRSYQQTSESTQSKQTTNTTNSAKSTEATQKSTTTTQKSTTTQKTTTTQKSATTQNSATTQKSTTTNTQKSTTSTSKANANGVTPELKEFCDEYEQLMDIYIYLMSHADEYAESTGRDAMVDYLAVMYRLTALQQAASELDEKEMTEADANYYAGTLMRIEMKLLNAALSEKE